jgi:DNA-binding CsgD family transcriptional regulator
VRLHAAGLQTEAIASEMGRSLRAVNHKRMALLPHRNIHFQHIASGFESGLVNPLRVGGGKRWTPQEDELVIELYTSGCTEERIERVASDLARTVLAVSERSKRTLAPSVKVPDKTRHSSHGSAGSEHKKPPCEISEPDPQSRRNFTTLYGWKLLSGISIQRRSSTLTYSSHRVVGVARRGVFSLPYRPQQRCEHTKSTSAKAAASEDPAPKRARVLCRFYMEELSQIIYLRAAGHTWNGIGEILGRRYSSIHLNAVSLLKEEQWVQRFEAAKSAMPDAEKHRHAGKNTPYTTEEDAWIVNMRKTGSKLQQIADALGCSISSVWSHWNRCLDEIRAHLDPLRSRASRRRQAVTTDARCRSDSMQNDSCARTTQEH